MKKAPNTHWLRGNIAIFDVESVGLHGEGFAVSLVLADNLTETWSVTWACLPNQSMGTPEDFKWVQEHVQYPPDTIWLGFPQQVRTCFWQKWLELREQKYLLCSDVTWPVEANFLSACVKDNLSERNWTGPYPLIDVNVLYRLGDPPRLRLPEHQPEHDPLADCRHSLRQLRAVLNKL